MERLFRFGIHFAPLAHGDAGLRTGSRGRKRTSTPVTGCSLTAPTYAFLADGELISLFETRSVCEGIQSEKSSMAA